MATYVRLRRKLYSVFFLIFLASAEISGFPQNDDPNRVGVRNTVRTTTTRSRVQQPVEGGMKLIGGNTESQGAVLIYHAGTYGIICDDGWNMDAARVVCRSLGWANALSFSTDNGFAINTTGLLMHLDDIQCYGNEAHVVNCRHLPWGVNDCDIREVAGVFCSPVRATRAPSTRPTTALRRTTTTTRPRSSRTRPAARVTGPTTPPRNHSVNPRPGSLLDEIMQLKRMAHVAPHMIHHPPRYRVRLAGGRNPNEGRVEIRIRGQWGVICSDTWTILEAMVVCRELGRGYAKIAARVNYFGGENSTKLVRGIRCDGEERRLHNCFHREVGDVTCPDATLIAGVLCHFTLPDLVPNATLLQESTYLQDRPMYYLQCAMEENCASSSAFEIKNTKSDWHQHMRRLLRFSSSTWNFGTADFRPFSRKESWEWHLCHMHYHSMAVFANYDLIDLKGNRVAEGHKASFCLEDVQCRPGVVKKYECKGYGDQGISVDCADDYLHDIDCQWIDITDVAPGRYIFKMHINPEYRVAEIDFSNNCATCDLHYTGISVNVRNCQIGRG